MNDDTDNVDEIASENGVKNCLKNYDQEEEYLDADDDKGDDDDDDDEVPVLLLLELDQHRTHIVDDWTLTPTDHILIDDGDYKHDYDDYKHDYD